MIHTSGYCLFQFELNCLHYHDLSLLLPVGADLTKCLCLCIGILLPLLLLFGSCLSASKLLQILLNLLFLNVKKYHAYVF